MVWNTIAHPRMMVNSNASSGGEGGVTSFPYPTKFADPHKMAYFDLIIDMSDADKPALVHGDYETIKNKTLNHEMVIAAAIKNVIQDNGVATRVAIMPMQIVTISYVHEDDKYTIWINNDWILTPDNTIKPAKEVGPK